MTKEWFCKIIKEVRNYYNRIDKICDALGCGECQNMYEYGLPGIIMDYIENQSGKEWPDYIYDDIYNHFNISPEIIWEKIEKLEVKNND